MRFNFYSYNLKSSKFLKLENSLLSDSLHKKLVAVEKEIVYEYLKKQQNRPGIKILGNEIKRNKGLKEVFGSVTEKEEVLFKLTAHYQSYTSAIIKALNEYKDKEIYLFVLDDVFRGASRLVDSSSKGALFIKETLDKVSSVFLPKQNCNDFLYIVEMKGFSDYSVVESHNYSKLIKRTF